MSQVLLAICNVPDSACARAIAAKLIESKAAACVNIGAPVESIYRWEGAMATAAEVPLSIKTTQDKYADVEAVIRSLHPYQVPELIAFPVTTGLPAYLDWVRAESA